MNDLGKIRELELRIDRLTGICEAQTQLLETMSRAIEDLHSAPLAPLLALIDTIDAHGISRNEFMKNLDVVGTLLFPDAESVGGSFATTVGQMTTTLSARRKVPPASSE